MPERGVSHYHECSTRRPPDVNHDRTRSHDAGRSHSTRELEARTHVSIMIDLLLVTGRLRLDSVLPLTKYIIVSRGGLSREAESASKSNQAKKRSRGQRAASPFFRQSQILASPRNAEP